MPVLINRHPPRNISASPNKEDLAVNSTRITPRMGHSSLTFVLLALVASAAAVRAAEYGKFTYTEDESSITITRYPRDGSGAISVPGEITGKPVKKIDDFAFAYCSGLTGVTLPASLAIIDDEAFRGCIGLTEFTIPAGVTVIGKKVFLECTNLRSITVEPNSGSFRSVDGVLFDKQVTTLRQCPAGRAGEFTIPPGVDRIEELAFADCAGLTAVDIPATVTTIWSEAFRNCSGLSRVTIPPRMTRIQSGIFSYCTSLTDVSIPEGVFEISSNAFFCCTSLAGIALPSSLIVLEGCFGNYTALRSITIPWRVDGLSCWLFSGCTGLVSVSVPPGLKGIGEWTFKGCRSLASFALPAGLRGIGYGAFAGCTSLTDIVIPAGVTQLYYAFQDCSGLVSVSLPAGLTEIVDYTFSGCVSLAVISVPAGVTRIGKSAFAGCRSLPGIAIPAGVDDIGDGAFADCSSLAFIDVHPDNAAYSSQDGALFDKQQTTLIHCPGGRSGTYAIPSGVKWIGPDAFAGCSSLVSVHIAASVSDIWETAFARCTSLTSISVDPANRDFSSVDGVLFDKHKSKLLQYPAGLTGPYAVPSGVFSIEYGAFSHCFGLTGVTLPASLHAIENEAFSRCHSLTEINFPPQLFTIGIASFAYCTGLTSVTIPASVVSMTSNAFPFCSGLTAVHVEQGNSYFCSVDGVLFRNGKSILLQYPAGRKGAYVVPSSVTWIYGSAFAGCSGLTSLVIPRVDSFGTGGLSGCVGLKSIIFMGPGFPAVLDQIDPVDPDLRVYYYNGQTGSAPHLWKAYHSVNMGTATPVKDWLIMSRLPYDADLSDDDDGDGVNLLMAYALNLDPARNPRGRLPEVELLEDEMKLRFYAGAAGVTYKVEASEDLVNWSIEGVLMSGMDAGQHRTATTALSGSQRFLRVVMSH